MSYGRIVLGALFIVLVGCARNQAVPPGSEMWSIDHLRRHPPQTAGEPIAYQRWVNSMMSGTCYVHGTQMRREWVSFSSDVSAENRIPENVRTTHFPFSLHVWYFGGEKLPPGKAEIFICPACDEARRVWLQRRQEPNLP